VVTNKTSKFKSLVSPALNDSKFEKYGAVSVIDEKAEGQEHTPNPSQ
jgi:hypothetical protein